MDKQPFIYLIAGEASGDLLGAGLMAALKRAKPDIRFAGIGGERMIAEGLAPLFPMSDLSVMGLVEVLSHLPRLIGRINQTVTDILTQKPDVVIGIDAPDFCFRVERKVRAANPAIKLVHYVAPSVWAWRPGRAKKIAAFLDHLFALLPFEPPYFEAVGLPCTFVGHPAVTNSPLPAGEDVSLSPQDLEKQVRGYTDFVQKPLTRSAYGGSPSPTGRGDIVLLLPGSRRSEVIRLLPLCLDVARALAKDNPNLLFVFPTVPHVVPLLREGLVGFDLPHVVVDSLIDKQNAFAAASAALAASGTVVLELALAGVPSVVCYRFSYLTGVIAHRVIRVKYASLPNLIFDREILPEFIQENARVELIAPALQDLLGDTPQRQAQLAATSGLANILKPDGIDPSARAAGVVLGLI